MTETDTILTWIDDHREELIEFLLEFANIPSPRGYEREASDFLHTWLSEQGIASRQQPVIADRSNVIGTIPGTAEGDAADLVFNAHIDTAYGNPEEDEWVIDRHHRIYSESWREGEYLLGDDVANDKGPMAAFLWAALALTANDVPLAGDLHLTATVGEIGGTTVDEYQNPQVLGSGIGTRRLVDSGITGDYAIVAETTDYAIGRMECGVAWFKITFLGDIKYQPRVALSNPDTVEADHPGALLRATRAAHLLEQWATEYRNENVREYGHGTVVPSAGVGAIRSGWPYNPSKVPGKAALYLDVRLPPGEGPNFVRGDIERVLSNAGLDATVESYMFRRGYVADDSEVIPLVDSISDAHQRIRGSQPPIPDSAVTSMWRDINVFNEVGVPAVTWGPPRSSETFSGTAHRCLAIDDLIEITKLYAVTAIDISGA